MNLTLRDRWLWSLASLLLMPSLLFGQTADWPYWRGPNMDGTAKVTGLPEDWDPDGGEGSNVIWKRDDLGGPCTPIAMNGFLYSIQRYLPGTEREGERVVCLDAETGETVWENNYNVWLSDVPAERVGWSSVVGDQETGNVYVLGACDIFMCIDGNSGETLWKVPLHEQFGMLSTYGGRTNFPIVYEDLVIISGIIINWGDYAKPNHRLLAMDKRTGEFVWFSGTRDLPYDTTYSAPSLVTVNGQRQLILGCGDGSVWGFQPRTGKPLWNHQLSLRGLFATPLVVGDMVFCSHSEENADDASVMGAVAGLKISGKGENTQVSQMWKHLEVVSGYSEPVYVDGRIYWVDDRCKMWVFDAETGEPIVERKAFAGSRQRSALLYADGKIYVTTENGRWAIVEPTEDGFEVLSKGRIRDTGFGASPIVADGKLYIQSTSAMYCVGTGEGKQEQQTLAGNLEPETPVEEDTEIAQVQVVPCEAVVQPGESIEYTVNVFNANGQKLETPAGVTFTVAGKAATVDGNKLTASQDASHTGIDVVAEVNGIKGNARVRIVPPLPWKFTFDGLTDPPLSWVGARYRHVIRDIDGSPALTKVTTIPKGARSRAWMGPSDLSEYTISADVRGKRMSAQLPDIGLTAHGYVLDLMGQSQQLQIRTWSAQLRMAETIDFPWEEDKWYRMKFRVDLESEGPATVAVLRGKVWPRDQDEPKEWTITARDESPNLASSPGLYGNAKVAELYLDNIEVVANESDE
ncbi:PQQ-binding-like beta-propeller repeat protein [Rhodopirellula sp. MGV]|uniref:outer membrane protein assembly factor BamB family protein n=1 Tax=Rhodopirellula sp. MGV TaxID=2023130 RepID=UPI000B97AC68|nr:PQQ-binding-like beta-propeller repeat protein [Rhodopirellula sp. MGV]OYP34889.1 serine/threonine protein kinase [Rhodopirellula sp. MGV]PNY38214.1 serine/threonine protein kinase [Rhodopirellula baltica]